jgi:hypothetical protein
METNTTVDSLLLTLRTIFPNCDPIEAVGALMIAAIAADDRLSAELATAAVDSISEVVRILTWFSDGDIPTSTGPHTSE